MTRNPVVYSMESKIASNSSDFTYCVVAFKNIIFEVKIKFSLFTVLSSLGAENMIRTLKRKNASASFLVLYSVH